MVFGIAQGGICTGHETPVFQTAGGREGGEVALGSRELGAAISMGTWLSIGEAILV